MKMLFGDGFFMMVRLLVISCVLWVSSVVVSVDLFVFVILVIRMVLFVIFIVLVW